MVELILMLGKDLVMKIKKLLLLEALQAQSMYVS
jgi:hypothetical protein